jgi:hypothetical protein
LNALIEAEKTYGLPVSGMAPGLALMFNEPLYERCKQIAQIMARASGITPGHLIGQSEACFAVVTRSITWKLDPFSVAQATYQTPGGKVGFEGKLVQAILENSGHIDGAVKFTHFGDWDRIRGKWVKKQGTKSEYAAQGWKDEDEVGLGVVVSAQVKGEKEPRELTVYLRECFPRNSTLWALRPSQQICYTAVRAFANVVAPGLFMGVPFSGDEDEQTMIDVTPASERPRRDTMAPKREEPETQPVQQQEPAAPHDPDTGEVKQEEEPHEPSPADAYELGYQAREANKPRRIPPEIDNMGEAYSAAWKGGWEARDNELASSKK